MQNVSERLAIVGVVNPASYGAGEQLSAAISLSGLRRLMAVVQTGVMGASATIDVSLKGSTTSGGTYTAITGAALVQIVKATGDNIQAELEVSPQRIEDLALGYTFVKLSVTVGVAASIVGAQVFADRTRYVDAALYDLSSVKQKVTLV